MRTVTFAEDGMTEHRLPVGNDLFARPQGVVVI
jgi:hypothetical protein